MTATVAAEYDAAAAEAAEVRTADPAIRRRATTRLRRELHRIQGRDFFTCSQRDAARRAVESLAAADTAGVRP
jgi:cobalamin biosynthesis protein CobD/CbiB